MTHYDQILDRLFSLSHSQRAKTELNGAQLLNARLHYPTSSYPTIHVAGSNGKGSVTTKIAKALELSGYRVGIYTSPHLFSFRERIAINSELISEEDVVEGMQKIFALAEKEATFFELTTFLAFEYFRLKNVDIAVIETGLGGRFDATNVIHPILSVITSISLEHVQILGKEIEQIAAEKAGIIKENVPVILGQRARFRAIYDKAEQMHSPVFAVKTVSYFFDEENSCIANLALEHLPSDLPLEPEAISRALRYRPPCRFEEMGHVIFDVAHNPEAIFYLLQGLHTFFPSKPLRFMVGFSKDKDYGACLGLIAPIATHIHLVQAISPRAATPFELQSALREDFSFFTLHASIAEGFLAASREALEKEELLIVCGSFYIMAEAKPKVYDTNEKILVSSAVT